MCRSRWCARPGADRRYFPGRRPALLSMLKNEQEGKVAAAAARARRVVRILRSHRRCQSSGRRRKGGKRREMCLPCPKSAVAGVFCRSRPSLRCLCSLHVASTIAGALALARLQFEFLGDLPAYVFLILSPNPITFPNFLCAGGLASLLRMVGIGDACFSVSPNYLSLAGTHQLRASWHLGILALGPRAESG